MMVEYTTTVQPLWRDWQSVCLQERNGMYHAPTAPVDPPHNGRIPEHCGPWSLHSVQMLPMLGEPKLLIVWMREVEVKS